MCYQVSELYSACRCIYYQNAVDRCPDYGRPGHGIQQRTIFVGYACGLHDPRGIPSGLSPQSQDDIADDESGTSGVVEASTTTNLTKPDSKDAENLIDLFLRDLIKEAQIQYLLPQLVQKSFNTKAAELICFDLLQWYALDLHNASTSSLQTQASRLLDSSCKTLSRRIIEIFAAERRLNPTTEINEEDEEDGEDEDEEDEEDEEITNRGLEVSYNSLYDFLFEGTPIETLKKRMRVTVEAACIDFSQRQQGIWQKVVNNMYLAYQRANFMPSKLLPHTSTKHGAERLDWKCVCGVRGTDDYVELRPGALEDLRVFLASYGPTISLQGSGVQITPSVTDGEGGLGFGNRLRIAMYAGINWWYSVSERSKQRQSTEGDALNCDNPRRSASALLRHRYLLACLPFMKWGLKLEQPDVCNIYSDQDFFRLLGDTYRRSRRNDPAKWLRTVSHLSFSQFEVFQHDIVAIRASPSMPSSEAKYDYDYELPDVDPPIGPNLAMHYFENPEHASALPVLFKRTPIKRNQRLAPCPEKGVASGWGVQFEDSVSGFVIFNCALVGFLLCLVVAIAWTVYLGDVQSGFGIGGFILVFVMFCATQIYLLAPGAQPAS